MPLRKMRLKDSLLESSDRRVPVIMALGDGISGVVSWAVRLQSEFKNHPKYNILFLQCGGHITSDICEFHALYREDAREFLSQQAPCLLIPNYIMDVFSIAVELISQGKEIRCIGICHADSQVEYYNPLVWFEPIISKFVAPTPECGRALNEQIPSRVEDITVLPYGLTIPNHLKRSYQHSPIRLAYAGRIVQIQKRILDFIPLVQCLTERGVNFIFNIVGDGSDLSRLKEGIVRCSQQHRIHFLGRMSLESMEEFWDKCDIDVFVQVSEFEALGLSMVEAMSHGVVPVVTAASGGIASLIKNGKNGFCVPVGSIDDLAEQIQYLASHPEVLVNMGAAAYETSKQFDIHSHARAFSRILDSTLETSLRKWPKRKSIEPQVRVESAGFLMDNT